jgi:hypothetical protein
MTALSIVLSLAAGAVSTSDLGVVFVGTSGSAPTLVTACPRAVKAELPLGGVGAGALLTSYEQQCGGGTGVVELGNVGFLPVTLTRAQGQLDAGNYFGAAIPAIFSAPGSATVVVDPATVDWIAGPPDFFTAIVPAGQPGAREYAAGFMETLAQRVQAEATLRGAAFRLLLPAPPAPVTQEFCDAFDAARLTSNGGVAWSWRVSVAPLTVPISGSLATLFGYDLARLACPNLPGAPLFVEVSTPGGWLASGRTSTAVAEWFRAVDQAADADADVHGSGAVMLRSAGGGVDDISGPLAAELATILTTPVTPDDGNPPPATNGVVPGVPPATTVPAGASRSDGGCGQPAGALALLGLVPLVLRRRWPRPLRAGRLSRRN